MTPWDRSAVSAVVLSLLIVGSLSATAGVGGGSGTEIVSGEQVTVDTNGADVERGSPANETGANETPPPLVGVANGATDSVTADREPPDDELAVVHSQAPSANTSVALTRVLARAEENELDFKVEFSSSENDTYSSTTIPVDADQDPSTGLTESDGFTGAILLPDSGIGADYIISQGGDAGSGVFEFNREAFEAGEDDFFDPVAAVDYEIVDSSTGTIEIGVDPTVMDVGTAFDFTVSTFFDGNGTNDLVDISPRDFVGESTLSDRAHDGSLTLQIDAEQPVVTGVTPPADPVAGESLPFNATVDGNASEVVWAFGDGTTTTADVEGNESSATHQYDAPGEYTVNVTAVGPAGNRTESVDLSVAPGNGESPLLAFTDSPMEGALGENLTFTAEAAGNITEIEFDLGDETTELLDSENQTDGEVSLTHTYEERGTYIVSATARGPAGTDTATTNVSVERSDLPPEDGWSVLHDQPVRSDLAVNVDRVRTQVDDELLHIEFGYARSNPDASFERQTLYIDTGNDAGLPVGESVRGAGLDANYAVFGGEEPSVQEIDSLGEESTVEDGIAYAEHDESAQTLAVGIDREKIDDPETLFENLVVSFAQTNGTEWTSPQHLTVPAGDVEPVGPDVAPLDDGWVVAWTERGDSSDVVYAVVDDSGAVTNEERITNATAHELTETDDGPELAYHDTAGDRVVREQVTATDRTELETYDAGVDQLAASADGVVWLEPDANTTVRYGTGGTVEELELGDRYDEVTALELAETDAGTALVYEAARSNGRETVAYSVERGGSWSADSELVATDSEEPVTVRHPSLAPATDGFVAPFGAQSPGPNTAEDIVTVSHEFRPDYNLTATVTDGTTPGEEATVEYKLTNVGDTAGVVDVPVEFRTGGGTVVTESVSPLAPEESVTGSATVKLGPTGTVDVVAGGDIDQRRHSNAETTLSVGSPALSIDEVSFERPSVDRGVARVTVENTGPVAARSVPVRLSDGDGVIGTRTLDGVNPESNATLTFEFDPRSVNRTTTSEIQLDPNGTLSSDAVKRPRKRVPLGQPELTIGSSVRYLDTRDGLVAEVPVRNRGPVAANLTLSAVALETNETVGERTRRVSPAIDGVGVGTEFLIPLDGVTDGGPVQFVLESGDLQTAVGTTVFEGQVGPTLEADFGPEPVVGQVPPRDLNGDGRYRDVDGTGEFDIFDVQAFFDNFDSDVVQNNPAAFNFDGSDSPDGVTIFDVQALFAALQEETT